MELTLFFLARNKQRRPRESGFLFFLNKFNGGKVRKRNKGAFLSFKGGARFVQSELSPVDGSRERERILKYCELSKSQDAILTWRSI